MEIKYTKLQGLGNDFIILDNRNYKFDLNVLKKMSKRLCKRRLSIGADGMMIVENSNEADFKMLFFNADGSIGEMCGNGARCIARYAYIIKIAPKNIKIETSSGIVKAEILDKRKVKVELNKPTILEIEKNIIIDEKPYTISYVELGNPGLPHAIIEYKGLKNTENKQIFTLAKALRNHEYFPKGANINFYEILDNNTIFIKTYERGVEDFTLACGTGAASTTLIVKMKNKIIDNIINVKMIGGELEVKLVENKDSWELYIIGDTNIISQGIVLDEELEIGEK